MRDVRGPIASGAAALLTCGASVFPVAGCGNSTRRSAASHPAPISSSTVATQPVRVRVLRVGTSVKGRPIVARRIGTTDATRNVLIVGCVHGNEPAGEAVTRYLRRERPPEGVAWWLVDEFNPDGCSANTRDNADGVDLNRNSLWHWRALFQKGSIFWSGPGPLSEPESRAINRLVLRIRPVLTIWYHQHAALVDTSSGGSRRLESLYSRLSGLPLVNYGVYPGSITTWQDATFPADTAFVVELPAGSLSNAGLLRHVRAVEAVSRAA